MFVANIAFDRALLAKRGVRCLQTVGKAVTGNRFATSCSSIASGMFDAEMTAGVGAYA